MAPVSEAPRVTGSWCRSPRWPGAGPRSPRPSRPSGRIGAHGYPYKSVLAGYRALQEDFDPAAAQSLVVFTNKDRDTTSGMSLPSLITRLEAESDPSKPIRVMGVGFGARADVRGLRRVSDAMGGKSARVNGPVAMLGLFINMIGQVSAQG